MTIAHILGACTFPCLPCSRGLYN